jgi:septal ring factor EnvC (AmiA/AmiB activator)
MKGWLIFFALFIMGLHGYSQSLEELRQKKKQAEDEIRLTNQLLNQVSTSQKETVSRLRLLNSQISQRNQLINTMSGEVSLLQEVINTNVLVVNMITEDLEDIRKEYALMIRYAYKNRGAYDKILFLLSAENFNQAYRRFIYIKQYAEIRQKQAETISLLQNILEQKIIDLENHRKTRQEVLTAQLDESKKLVGEKNQQNSLARKLEGQQRDLRNKLAQARRIEQQLENEIQKIIEEEARKSGKSEESGFAMTPEQKLTGTNFEQNKRRLPWPVERGVITEKFGVHPHPVLRNVTVNNNGIDIATSSGSKVRSVFTGEVSRVFGITGGNMAVIIRHGQYLSVYSNLVNIIVKKGDKVEARQNIGSVFTDPEDGNKSVLKFQIWKESTKLNPEEWLGR